MPYVHRVVGVDVDELDRLRGLRDALRKTRVAGEVLRVEGACVSVKLILPVSAWPLLAWAVSDSPEMMENEPLRRMDK